MPKKRPRLSEHLTNTDPATGFDGYVHRPDPAHGTDGGQTTRLALRLSPTRDYAAAQVVDAIERAYGEALFFADSSFFDDTLDESIWQALLSRERRVALLPQVETELGGWLATHESSPVAEAVTGRAGAFHQVDFGAWSTEDVASLTYYVQLLAFRKSLYKLAQYKGESDRGRSLTDAELLHVKREVLEQYGHRAVVLARKAASRDPSTTTFYTDEIVVAAAFFSAIRTGRPAVVLTRDEDLLEQFYKLQWLLDTQYRGMLLADAYLDDLRPTIAMPTGEPWADVFVGSTNRLFERSDGDLEAVLPARYEMARVECWLLGAEQTILTFNAESGMNRLLDVKGRTGGLNTDRLEPRNCHIWLGPLPVAGEFRGCAAIATDRRVQMQSAAVALPMLDVQQSLTTIERFKRQLGSMAAI